MEINQLTPIIMGEVLLDVFPGKKGVLGGAPFNVACHLKGLGLDPLFLSRIGRDPEGKRVLERMSAWNIETHSIEFDDTHPTGTVQVFLEQGQPSFEILPEQAYDYIDGSGLQDLNIENAGLVYCGSLILRSTTPETSLRNILQRTGLPLFVDLNLRTPWYSEKTISYLLDSATWLKVSEEELAVVLKGRDMEPQEFLEEGPSICSKLGLARLIVTYGARGAAAADRDTAFFSPPSVPGTIANTVGAGDSMSAMMIRGILQNTPMDESLDLGVKIASAVCTIDSAVPREQGEFYSDFS